jgi:glutathione S-transferase
MTLHLYFHPLSSYSHKVLIALYESGADFERHVLAPDDPETLAKFRELWPIGKFPVLHDDAEDRTIPESTTIIEYLAQRAPAAASLIPADPDLARQTRFRDRFLDLYVHTPMQTIVDHARGAPGASDPMAVELARRTLAIAYDLAEQDMAGRAWAMGETFTLADCAAAPALFYAARAAPFSETHPNLAAYLERLKARPAYARVLREAAPYFHMLPI